ncbi:ZIP family metal transporter [Colwellia sp. 20A7]|uniref:ZIP family metal transporter n=1 Tax=Colwellia sp. 20A7 TaxID=2689569 RepID=UPI00191679E9|nr:ZIP family metal transporter [Colwellia sp. 20A7]
MTVLTWIIISGLFMSLMALIVNVTLLLNISTIEKLLLPLIYFAAGSLFGSVFFHILPFVHKINNSSESLAVLIMAGFTIFFILKQLLHWKYRLNSLEKNKKQMTYIMMIGGAFQSFLAGMMIGGTFLIDTRLGLICWLAIVVHEVPQKLLDLTTLFYTGWSKRSVLIFNLLSSPTYLLGGITAYILFFQIDILWLIPFAAGNFIYIGLSDLVSETNRYISLKLESKVIAVIAFIFGFYLFFWVMS